MKKILATMFALLAMGQVAMAQRQRMTEEERAKAQAERIEKQATRMSKELKLEGDAKEAFETTYKKYQEELTATMTLDGQRRDRNVDADDLSDEDCYAKITENLAQQEKQIEQMQKRLEITKKYMAELLPTLSAQQLYKVFGQPQRGNFGGGQREGGSRGDFGGGFGRGGFGGGTGRGGFGGAGF